MFTTTLAETGVGFTLADSCHMQGPSLLLGSGFCPVRPLCLLGAVLRPEAAPDSSLDVLPAVIPWYLPLQMTLCPKGGRPDLAPRLLHPSDSCWVLPILRPFPADGGTSLPLGDAHLPLLLVRVMAGLVIQWCNVVGRRFQSWENRLWCFLVV